MKHTSLQNIITTDHKHLQQSQLRKLFQKQQYPRFELKDLRDNPELMKKQPYVFFLNLLQEWNKSVGNPAKELNQCEYHKNEFIFSWLKWAGVQSSKYIDSSLCQLRNWYNSSRHKQPVIGIQKYNMMKSCAEEWQIRNSYKSNLPLQIDNYKRRGLFQLKTAVSSPQQPQEKENVKIIDLLKVKMLDQSEKYKFQNSCLRQVREKQEMDDYLSTFRKTKVQFYKNLTKNYYKKEFSKDKLEFDGSKSKDLISKSQIIRPYMIKTSAQGFKKLSNIDTSKLNQTEVPFYQTKMNSLLKQDSNENEMKTSFNEYKSLNTSNIDGLGLLNNPFEIKIKKKKRN